MKGVGGILLLIHHLFGESNLPYYTVLSGNIGGRALLFFSHGCKICVALFIILSGFGLTKSYNKKHGNNSATSSFKESILFSLNHIKKLLFQYWWAVIPLAAFGVISGMRPLSDVYGTEFGWFFRLFTDVLGINYLLYGLNYLFNITCWYMSVALLTYFLFPFLNQILQKNRITFCAVIIASIALPKFLPINGLKWIVYFEIGMLLAYTGALDLAVKSVNGKKALTDIGITIAFVFSAILYYYNHDLFGGLFAVSIIVFVLMAYNRLRFIGKPLAFVGKHSANIFMMHTFFYHYYFREVIYFLKYPVLVLATLLAVCLAYSAILQSFKMLFSKFIYKIRKGKTFA